MTTLSKSQPPMVIRDSDEERRDLLLDVEALLATGDDYPQAAASCTRPSILRRLAGFAAMAVPAGTDRLLADAEDTVFVTAVSLHTGIPFATLDASTKTVFGEVHPGENVMVIAYHRSPRLASIAEWVRSHGCLANGPLCVVGPLSGPEDAQGGSTLITYAPLQFSEGDGR